MAERKTMMFGGGDPTTGTMVLGDRDTVVFGGPESESITSRDANDELIAREVITAEKLKEKVRLTIDGKRIVVPKATKVRDFLGNVVLDSDGNAKLRATTIYDAAQLLAEELVAEGEWAPDELQRRIPVLCHRDHLHPIAVCRMCSVHVSKYKKSTGRVEPNDKLVPACQHEVQEEMSVTTWCGGEPGSASDKYATQVKGAVSLLSEMLLADHHKPDPKRDSLYVNELENVASSLFGRLPKPNELRFTPSEGRNSDLHPKSRRIGLNMAEPVDPELPYSSRSISVDHDLCILCDRCARSCSDVKPFKVIGHTGKGYKTRISFDLDQFQNDSSCVQCGECMTACPTGALTLKRRVAPSAFPFADPIPIDPAKPLPEGFLTATEMQQVTLQYFDLDERVPKDFLPERERIKLTADEYLARLDLERERRCRKKFKPFAEIPFSYLRWNEGAVRRRHVSAGEYLCRQGDYASTAFFIESGRYDILYEPVTESVPTGLAKLFSKPKRTVGKSVNLATIDQSALLIGELACLNNEPRTTSIRAATDGYVYEVTRNILDMARRSPNARYFINTIYRKNALRACIKGLQIFKDLSDKEQDAALSFLNEPGAADFKMVEPGTTIVREGEVAADFYMIFRGFVKFTKNINGVERVENYSGKGESFGDLALLARHPDVAPYWSGDPDKPLRTVTVTALDPVEVIRVDGDHFRDLCERVPSIVKPIAERAKGYQNRPAKKGGIESEHMTDFLEQGLYQGQKLLVIDLESCTRCDECTRACADSHHGVSLLGKSQSVSRLLREGQRFGDFLVATSCRSCHKPYCMEGCPVDAINRSGTGKEIRINRNTCIGCSLCEQNCPYGAIQMVPKDASDVTKGYTAKGPREAVDCDLCAGLVPEGADTFCVAACPHEAAFRWDGKKLLDTVKERSARNVS